MGTKWTGTVAFLCGATLGVIAGIYFAPKSGEEMREDLSEQINEGARRVQTASRSVARRAQEMADQIQKSVSDLADTGMRISRKVNPS
jgi:gas vesicle protein